MVTSSTPGAPRIPATTEVPVALGRIRTLVTLLETAFRVPGTRIRFGVDALIGLLPGLGDIVGGVLSAVVIGEAIRAGVPGPVLARMFANIAVDVLAGAVPVAGDLFDVYWKAGVRNLSLLEAYHHHPERTSGAARRLLLGLGMAIGLLAAASVAVAAASVVLLIQWLGG